jgi:23S rRNA pseudouridine1911/1915/1917 synthase
VRSILFENDSYLVVDKPGGVSMATPRSKLAAAPEEDAPEPGSAGAPAVRRILEALGLPCAGPLPLLVHRLDVGTSGCVLLAKGQAAHRTASLAFQERRVTKVYRALAWGHPVPAAGAFLDALSRDRADARKMRTAPDGKAAVTAYRTLRRYRSLADLELTPETGRTHQIRVHLSAHGHPIAGDDLYGGATRWRGVREPAVRAALAALARPLLHAERLAVPEAGVDVAAPLPADYARLLDLLRAVGK